MSFDFQRRGCSFSPYSPFDISRKYQENILYDYKHAWDVNNESLIRSCEQRLIELDKKTLVGYLQKFVRKQSQSWLLESVIKQTVNKYASCVLHLTHVFCIPGQEEKIKVVQVELNKMLQYCTEEERYNIFERYISQQLKAKPNVIEIDFLTGQIDPHHELLLKLCYWDVFCAERNNECSLSKEFLQQNVDFLVSNIERSFQVENLEKEKIKIISCTMLLCLLNWNICKIQTPVTLQNLEAPVSSSDALVADTSPHNYSFTAYKVSNILHKILSTLSKDDIFTVFKNYIHKLYTMISNLTEDDFCTGKIDPYDEFLLKFCYCERLCSKNDAFCIEFLRRNADLFVSQIELVVNGENKKLKPISCTILLCLLNLNMCTLKTTPLMVQNTELQACPSDASVADTSTKYYYTAKTIWSLLKTLLSTLSEEDMFTTFNNYLGQLYAINSEITEEDLCTGKIEPYHEFLLKLCYCEKLCNKMDDEIYKEFLRRNADYLVTQIEEVVHGNKITKLASCKVLLHLLNWNICTLKSTLTQSKIQNNAIKEQCSLQSEERDTTKESCTMYKVRCVLQNLLSTLTNDDIMEVFNDYIDQMYTIKSELSPDGLCIGETGSNHEYQLKLCYWTTICRKNDNKAFKKFIQLYPEVLVSDIKKRIVLCQGTKTKRFFCKILLCILNWNICTLKKVPLLVKNAAIQASSSVVIIDDSPPKYSEETIRSMLQSLLSIFSEEEIFTAFNNYLDILYAINSEITEEDLCTGKIEPYHEFLLKLCYCEKLCIKKDEKKIKKFLSRNADFLVSQIEEGVIGKKKQLISCKVLLCLCKWGISNQNTAYTSRENSLSQTLTFNADYQDFINENALVFLSMVDTVMTKNNITVLINLCEVLLCIPYNGQHFHDIIGAVIKLIRFYATQVGINKKCLGWIIKLRYRVLRHVNDNQKLDTAIKIDFQNLFNLLDALLTYFNYNSKTLERGILNSFKSKIINRRRKRNNDTCTCFRLHYKYHTKEDYEDFISLYLSGEYKDLASFYYSEGGYEDFAPHYHAMELYETRLKELWIDKIKCKVKATQILNKIRNQGRKNLKPKKFLQSNITMSEQDFIYEWKAGLKENQLNIQKMEAELKEIQMVDKKVDEIMKNIKLYEMLVLFMVTLIVMVGVSNGHHKSAKLKKYLSLKYEYATASLYLLWCSGDIEVHPGPCMQKKALVHDSSIERRWIQNISPKILIRLPEHEQSKYKPTKKDRNDMKNREHFKALLKTCLEESIPIPKMYLAEINAWETMEYKLLHNLFVCRCEIETIITSLQDFFICGGSTKDLTDINVSLDTELKTNDITTILGKDHRPTNKSKLIVYITRHIAGIAIKCAHGKDPDAKCDGLWDLPLKNWPKDIILFDPNNRVKYREKNGKKLIPDQKLVDMLLRLPQVTIPQKYEDIIEAFKAMRKFKTKQHKEQLCRSTSLKKINDALKNLCKNGILTEAIYDILTKWWKTGTVESRDDQTQSLENMDDARKIERPHVLIYIHTKSITFTVEPTSQNSSQVSYKFPVKYELVPLKTMKLLPTPEDNPGDNQTNSIIPQAKMNISNSITTFDPNSQAMFRSELQCKTSTQDTASSSMTHLNQTTSSSFQFSQSTQNITIYGQPGPILCTHNQLTTNSDDLGHLHLSATIDSKNLAFQNLVSPTSDMGSSYSISSVNSESGNEERDQNNTLSEGQDLLTDSDYSSDSRNNCVSKTSLKKRKCIEKDRIEMKKRKIPSLKQDKKQSDPTNHRKDDSSMDNSTIFNTNMELLQDCLQIDLDSFVFDDQTFDVKLNDLDNEDKNQQICDKDGNLMDGETQMSNENTKIGAYNTSVSTILEKFVQDMINKEHEKMSKMKTSLSEV